MFGSKALVAQSGAVAEESVPAAIKNSPATHKQKAIVEVAKNQVGAKLEDFCVDAKGRILALLGPTQAGFGDSAFGEEAGINLSALLTGKQPPQFASAVHAYDSEGELIAKWPVGFSGQAIATAPDGSILIGGDGRVARFDAQGKKVHEAESPQMTYIKANPDEMRERAKDQRESDLATYADQLKQFEDQLKELQDAKGKRAADAKEPAEASDVEQAAANEQQLTQYVEIYKQQLQRIEKQTVEQVLEQVIARARQTHSITASDNEVFVSCPAMAGWGYGVWRTDSEFGQAKEIIKSLSGCCGQMDVQCHNGELYVCENSRHRVIRFDREGKEVAQFGKRDRTGEGENFGGCCNPMNLCFNQQGDLYVSESNGVVKHFTAGGKYLGIVGVADVQPGCKNSCVGVTTDDDRLYYIDIQKSQIIVLARDKTLAEK